MSDEPYIRRCPICGTPTVVERDTTEGAVCEEDERCPHGCYVYEFRYGYSSWYICGMEWHESWTASEENLEGGRMTRHDWIEEHRRV